MDVRLPNLGEGVDSGSVVALFVKEGDTISKGQTLLELENEKAVAPIPSPAEGRIARIKVKPGDKISVGQTILTLAEPEPGAEPATPKARAPEPKPVAEAEAARPEQPPEAPSEPGEEPVRGAASQKVGFPPPAAPSVRKLARDLGIDLTRVRGSQPGGRIVVHDIRSYIQRLQQSVFGQKKAPARAPAPEAVDFARWGPVSSKPMSSLRQVISRRLTESWATIPHVTQFDEADLARITELRTKYAAAYEQNGTRLTVTAFILKGVALMLKKHPIFNSSMDERNQTVVYKEYVHIGLAVDTEAGLLVPVIRDVDSKTLIQLSKDVQDLAARARDRKLALDDMKGGTFTISNQGGIGSAHFTPIINKPEAAILGLGRAAPKPAVRDNQVVVRTLLPLALSYDHRLIDGAQAARFMVDLVSSLETFKEEDVKL